MGVILQLSVLTGLKLDLLNKLESLFSTIQELKITLNPSIFATKESLLKTALKSTL